MEVSEIKLLEGKITAGNVVSSIETTHKETMITRLLVADKCQHENDK